MKFDSIVVSVPRVRSFAIFLLLPALLSGCASVRQIPLAKSAASQFAGKDLIIVKRTMPDFGAVTAGKMVTGSLFGAIGGAIAGASMVSAGNSLVQKNGIPDPAYEIGGQLARFMESNYSAKYVGVGSSTISDDNPSSVSTAYKAAPLALDIKTLNWGFSYLPLSWSRYRVIYNARLRLIDNRTGDVVAEGKCSSMPEKTDDAPTYGELVDHGATRLKAEIKKAVDFCVQEFSSKYLGP